MTTTQQTQDRMTPFQLAERNAELVRAKDTGKSFTEVAELFGVTRGQAHKAYWQTVAAVPQQAVAEMRANQNARLEWLMEQAIEVLEATHYVHSGGEIVHGPRQKPLVDHGPKLAAIARIESLVATQAKLNGTNAPAQVTVNGQISFVINNVDMGNLS